MNIKGFSPPMNHRFTALHRQLMVVPYSCSRPSEMSVGLDIPAFGFNYPQASSITWMDIGLLMQLCVRVRVCVCVCVLNRKISNRTFKSGPSV
jgi:hypothetical protein